MKKWLARLGLLFLLLALALGFWLYSNLRDRHSDYRLDLAISNSTPRPLKVGFAALVITPKVEDTWLDKNGDAAFNEKDGDTYSDNNGNGKFEAYWIAGFGHARAANGVHDDLWARAMVLDDGTTRLALVVLDAIGFMHDEVIAVRQRIPASAEIDYAIVASTHVHQAPDLMGLWGASEFESGVNQEYLAFVREQAAQAVAQAARNLRPAQLRLAQDLEGAKALVNDSRPPLVFDHGLRVLQALDAEADTTLGTLIAWADHPETLWSQNLLLSSDFPHYVRAGVERGVFVNDTLRAPGLGGVAVYVNGALGGLMTTNDGFPIRALSRFAEYQLPSFEKAQAQGERLAWLALNALRSDSATSMTTGAINLRAKTIALPLDNTGFRLATALGLIDRGLSGWMTIRTEVAAFTLGNMSFVCIPGEIYPEIVNGGIAAPDGQDYAIAPIELPPLREAMPGAFKFVFGLANDEVGYLIPKSEWDEQPPYLYGAKEQLYGEINSLGPNTAMLIHREVLRLLGEL